MWAGDSLKEADHAYKGIKYVAQPPTTATDHGALELKDVQITGPGATYIQQYKPVARSQLTLGAQHLACLLQAALQ